MLFLNQKLTISFFCIFIFNSLLQLSAQTDSLAVNSGTSITYNSDDYQAIRYKPKLITNLPGSVKETSGLIFFNRQLWTINDSGNKPEIYELDSVHGTVVRTVVVKNAVNTDWESMCQDDSHIYIGDFGNNAGNRKNLSILKIAKSELLITGFDTVKPEYIHFVYPDQASFIPAFNGNNYDCEAFFYHKDSLHLFSKNWSDLQTKHYVVPSTPGNYSARFAGSFNADGLITDASMNEKGNIVLLGYKNTRGRSYSCFVWLLSGYNGSLYFEGNKTRVALGSALHLGQTEGVVLRDDNTGWISAESIEVGRIVKPAKLFSFDFTEYFEY